MSVGLKMQKMYSGWFQLKQINTGPCTWCNGHIYRYYLQATNLRLPVTASVNRLCDIALAHKWMVPDDGNALMYKGDHSIPMFIILVCKWLAVARRSHKGQTVIFILCISKCPVSCFNASPFTTIITIWDHYDEPQTKTSDILAYCQGNGFRITVFCDGKPQVTVGSPDR